MQAIKDFLQKYAPEYLNMWLNYANFEARTTVRGYWMAILINFLVSLVLGIIPFVGWILAGPYALAVLVPGLAIMIRRLRDAGKHWTNVFWLFLPFAGVIIVIIFLCKPSVADDGTPVV